MHVLASDWSDQQMRASSRLRWPRFRNSVRSQIDQSAPRTRTRRTILTVCVRTIVQNWSLSDPGCAAPTATSTSTVRSGKYHASHDLSQVNALQGAPCTVFREWFAPPVLTSQPRGRDGQLTLKRATKRKLGKVHHTERVLFPSLPGTPSVDRRGDRSPDMR